MTRSPGTGLKAFILCFAAVPALILVVAVAQHVAARRATAAAPAQTTSQAAEATSSPLGGGACEVQSLVGFHAREDWGAWSETDPAELLLTHEVAGAIHVRLVAYTLADSVSHRLTIAIGDAANVVTLTPEPKPFELDYQLSRPASKIVLSGIAPRSPQDAGLALDSRKVGVGLVKIDCQPVDGK